MSGKPRARVIAMYLPQFHPVPENDEWWGKGFTEWTNTAKAKPLFRGHYQPHVPADLGFYDLRLPEARAAQAELAREYGVEAFCYYHYWFAGRELLERPLNEVVASGQPELPFCVCWANQTWSGVWHGLSNRVLIEQTYPGAEDDRAHFDRLLPMFRDKRYLTVDGSPLFMIYNPEEITDSVVTMERWRSMAREAGLRGLFIVAEHRDPAWDPRSHGFDAVMLTRLPPRRRGWTPWSRPLVKIRNKVLDSLGHPTVVPYQSVIDGLVLDPVAGIESFPCLIPNWDNTPRSGSRGLVLQGSTPERFRGHLKRGIERVQNSPEDHRLLFIKSWNEWAEGNHLEPDLRFGRQYLEVLRDEVYRDQP